MCAYMIVSVYNNKAFMLLDFLITVIWLYFALKIFRTLLFRAVLISYAPHIVYETRVKISLLIVRLIFVRTAAYEIK